MSTLNKDEMNDLTNDLWNLRQAVGALYEHVVPDEVDYTAYSRDQLLEIASFVKQAFNKTTDICYRWTTPTLNTRHSERIEKNKKRESEECKECDTSKEKCTGCDKGLCCNCVVHGCDSCDTIYGEDGCECELSPYDPFDYDVYHRDCFLASKKQKTVTE